MKRTTLLAVACAACMLAQARSLPFGKGRLTVTPLAPNAVRIQYSESASQLPELPEWLYVASPAVNSDGPVVKVDAARKRLIVKDRKGRQVFTATRHQMEGTQATLSFASSADEYLFGLGQFQDGYANVRGLSRRLTQVNTQISIPMLLSSKGYGVLWNNYGLTDFNPASDSVSLKPLSVSSSSEVVNVTSTEGTRQETRQRNVFEATIDVADAGDYTILLYVGQKMARRHNLEVDGQTVLEMQNLWLPPTASTIVRLDAGHHTLKAELSRGDQPLVYYKKVTDETVFRSPVAASVDYTVFVGSPDEIIATYRELTGKAPLMPSWALGYIHCRERFHSSEEILQTANRFRREGMPVSLLVQDWQYWGKYGWNAMQFDEDFYPDPKALTDSLHQMNMHLMLSVWSKVDKNSEVGKQMEANSYYIPGTDWIDFFNPEAAAAYWKNFSERLVPLGIDAWWQDATEPENDDLAGRRVNNGRWAGELVRNVYPLLVNKTVYEGLRSVGVEQPMILTRCGFPGIQRYGSALWSGDVGNDWETLRRQIVAGLGIQAAGIPWWTYDAGGFFRPGDQYTNQDYIERMLRWIETSVYLPLMRVHGYMSNTEPWNYGPEAQAVIADCLRERYRLLPYINKCAERVSTEGYTLMRPLVFDFADDVEALKQKYEYMFGPALLVSPVTEPGVTEWRTYLPRNEGGWRDYRTGQHYDGGQYVTTQVTKAYIPVFCRVGHDELLPPQGAGQCRNVFVEMGYDAAAVDAKLKEVFNDVFYGPNKVYFEVGDSMGYISDIKNHDVRTEGMSYGMMIAVQLDKKDIFDRLWRWSRKYMQHHDGQRDGYFAWSCKTDGTRNAQGAASDGELYFITSLLFASNRWGNDTGIDYKAEARHILDSTMPRDFKAERPMRQFPGMNMPPSSGKIFLIDPMTHLITFTPDGFGQRYTDPSYHLPAFYEVWARWADDGRSELWLDCASKARAFLHKAIDEKTGLNPDMCNYDGTLLPGFGGRRNGGSCFRYDSWRVPMNITLDYEWSGADSEWQQQYGERIQNFFYRQGVDKFLDQYRVDGSLPEDDEVLQAGGFRKLRHSIGLVATTAAASILTFRGVQDTGSSAKTPSAISKEFVDALWNAKHVPFDDGYFDAYYDGLLRLFSFMHLSGNYRVVEPAK